MFNERESFQSREISELSATPTACGKLVRSLKEGKREILQEQEKILSVPFRRMLCMLQVVEIKLDTCLCS